MVKILSDKLKPFISVISENLRLILVGFISILMIIAGAVVISLYFGGEVARQPVITDIKGSAYITRGVRRSSADKNSRLQSGDVVTTSENGSLRINIDGDKYVFVEPNSSVYIYYTEVAGKGDISVNLSKGAVICQLNKELKKKATFSLKTPNSSVAVRGTVFRAQFDYKEKYMDIDNVMITQVQNFDGTVALQLYDIDKQPVELPMVLIERTAAQLVTSETVCKYGYLNYSFDLLTLNDLTLGELIRSGSETRLAFTPQEINNAYKIVRAERQKQETATGTSVTAESGTDITEITSEITTTSETTTTSPPTDTEDSDSGGTLRTTQKTHLYTTYSGIKWWEITGNTNTGTDDYEDWFPEAENGGTLFGEETTVTAGTSAAN